MSIRIENATTRVVGLEGFVAEVQVHDAEFFGLKSAGGHKGYTTRRNMLAQ